MTENVVSHIKVEYIEEPRTLRTSALQRLDDRLCVWRVIMAVLSVRMAVREGEDGRSPREGGGEGKLRRGTAEEP